ncbi:phage tail tape measure protein [Pseudomonas sp. GL-RE-26]|uniref:phage tail tape measure protein n=1 Tax=Pseudomonas sp. GL-RE-26 TaxID=2832390 RepID=UPI001CBC58BC|nr:phage tail tape measure protein [Pseudomonas sp. GL-RE-26]
MSGTIAQLGVEVNSTEAVQAATDLDRLAQAGAKAEKATEGLTGQSKQAGASIKAMAAETKAAEAATSKLYKQTEAAGISAKQTAAALRGVPAQMTDIVTSLQGGQSPLTVLLQQGGQLKDMFGGIGPAARALGGYVLGLVNPFTLAAAAAAGLGVAYYKGSEEATAYSNALILTGNAAGTSADQLASLANQVSSTVGTTGAAAEVLAQLAGNGKIAGEAFGTVATAALEMETATGKAIEETIAEFALIAKDPVEAAKKLNDQYNFLTAAVYSQIVALKEQGDTIGAAKLLTDTYADTIDTRTKQVTANLSLIEKGWKLIKEESKKALDATLDVGRTPSVDAQISNLEKVLADRKGSLLASLFPDDLGENSRSTKFIEDQIAALKRAKVQIEENAKAEGDRAKTQRDGIDASLRLKAISDGNLTNEEKRNKLIKEYGRDVEALRKANPNDPLVQDDVVAKTIQNIKDKNKDPAGTANQVNLSGYNDAQNAIKALQATYSNTEKELEAQQKAGLITQQNYLDQRTALIRAEREEVTGAYQAEIAALDAAKDKAGTTGAQRIQLDQKIADARTNMVKAQKDADSQLEVLASNEEGRLKKQALAIQTYTDALQQQVTTLRQQGQREAAGLGMGDRQRGLNNQFDGIDDKANQLRIDLANQYGDGSRGMSLDEYNAKLKAVTQSQQALRNTATENYDAMTAAQGDWSAGASSAWQNYLESARDVAGQTKSLFTNAFSGMEDAVANFAISGKFAFSDFTKSILADMARIATRQAASGLLSSIASTAVSAYFSSGSSAAASAGSTQAGYTGSDFSSWVSGQRATGGPVAANSLYEVNELGPELYNEGGRSFLMTGANGGSVTPLTTGGGAGIQAMSGGGATQISVQVNVASDGSTSATSSDPSYQQFGKELGDFVEQKYRQLLRKDLGQGGSITRAIKG